MESEQARIMNYTDGTGCPGTTTDFYIHLQKDTGNMKEWPFFQNIREAVRILRGK